MVTSGGGRRVAKDVRVCACGDVFRGGCQSLAPGLAVTCVARCAVQCTRAQSVRPGLVPGPQGKPRTCVCPLEGMKVAFRGPSGPFGRGRVPPESIHGTGDEALIRSGVPWCVQPFPWGGGVMTSWTPGSSCHRCRRTRSRRVSRSTAATGASRAGPHASAAARCTAGRRCDCATPRPRSVRRRVDPIRRQQRQWW